MASLVNHLQQQHVQQAILIPAGYLSFLPLHAAWTEDADSPTGRRYACDEIPFTYSPNALSLTELPEPTHRLAPGWGRWCYFLPLVSFRPQHHAAPQPFLRPLASSNP